MTTDKALFHPAEFMQSFRQRLQHTAQERGVSQYAQFRIEHPTGELRIRFYDVDDPVSKAAIYIKTLEPDISQDRLRQYDQAATAYLTGLGLSSKQDILTESYLKKLLEKRLSEIVAAAPQSYTATDAGVRGVYNIRVHQNKDGRCSLIIMVAPPDYLQSMALGYVQPDHTWEISAHTTEKVLADGLMQAAKQCMEKMGFHPYVPHSRKVEDLQIDPASLDPDSFHLTQHPGRSDTPEVYIRNEAGKKQPIRFSTGTTNAENQQTILTRAQQFVRNRQQTGEAFIRSELVEFATEGLRDKRESKPRNPRPADRRIIYGGDGQPKLQLLTPTLEQESGNHHSYRCTIRAIPGNNAALSVCSSSYSIPLAAASKAEALSLLHQAQDAAELALTNYFRQHPNTSIVTELRPRPVGGAKNRHIADLPVFRVPAPGEHDTPDRIYFDSLRDKVLAPALNHHDSLVKWRIESAETGHGRKRVHFQLTNLKGEPVNGPMTEFGRGFTVELRGLHAEGFAQTLMDELNESQFRISQHATGDSRAKLIARSSVLSVKHAMNAHSAKPLADSDGAQMLGLIQRGIFTGEKCFPEPISHADRNGHLGTHSHTDPAQKLAPVPPR